MSTPEQPHPSQAHPQVPPRQAPPPTQQQQQQGRGGPVQGRHGDGRGAGGRHLYQPGRGGGQGPSSHHHQHPHQQPISLNPNSGIPYGHVPAYLPGSASLVEQLDQRVLVVLRDGKHVIGELASFDQFSNMILQDAVERRFYTPQQQQSNQTTRKTFYCDVPLGIYVIRGDSMVLMGEIPPNDANIPVPMEEATLEELEKMEQEDASASKAAGENAPAGPLTWEFDTDLIA